MAFHAFIHQFEGRREKGLSWRGESGWIKTHQVHVLGRMYNRGLTRNERRRSVGASDITKTD